MDLSTLLDQIERNRDFYTLANDPAIQFGPPNRPLLGPTILPERTVENNAYSEEGVRYVTMIANDGTKYSPAQRRPNGMIFGTFLVSLGYQDIANEFTSRDYDALLRYLQRNASMEATMALMRWVDTQLVQPLVQLMEKQRWDALVSASVTRTGDNGYSEIVTYPNPAGARSAAGGAWTNDAYDPYDDIVAKINYLLDKGFAANRIVTSRKVGMYMTRNDKLALRVGGARVLGNGTVITGRPTVGNINDYLNSEGIPSIEFYDGTYRDLAGVHRYLAEDAMVILATTGNDETIALPNGEPRIVENVLGYSAIGTGAGQSTPGRVINTEAYRNKPPRIEGECWQASLPVILEPEAVTVITGIA